MEWEVLFELINNAALLLSLSIIYELVYLMPLRFRRIQPFVCGGFIALICSVIMSLPFTLQSGIIFDTRSILISVTGLIFGSIPVAIVAAVALTTRIIIGGVGTVSGIAVILSSALIGLAWRRWLYPKATKWRGLNIYLMSISVHITMLLCMLLIPYPSSWEVIRAITVPVLLIYPLASVILSLLLMHQQQLKQAQDQLRQSEERFKLLFDKAPLGYQSLDESGHFLEINQQWCALLGYTKDEVLGKWFGDFLLPEQQELFRKRFPLFRAQGHIHSEFEVLHKNGTPVFIAFEGRIGYDDQGQFKQTHCILQDITSQKEAEAALAESEKKYRHIAENISDVVWQTDLDFKTVYVSPSIEKLFGVSAETYMGRVLYEEFPPSAMEELIALISKELENEKDPTVDRNRSLSIELELIRADDSMIWVETNFSFVRDARGNATGFIGVSRNVTSRKLAEIALHESERSKSILLANLPGLAYRCLYDEQGTMLIVSEGCQKLTGYASESFVHNRDLSFNSIITPAYQDVLAEEWRRTVPYQMPYRVEYEIMTATGERKWVLEMGQGLYNEKGNVEALEGIILDITDRKEMENNLRYIGEHDRWTGLYNRDYLESLLLKDLQRQDGQKRALISVNLSTVQLLTANYGFHYTQNLIKSAAMSLDQFSNDNRVLCQTYGNRFVFYVIGYLDQAELTDFCAAIAEHMQTVFATDRISGGIGVLEVDGENQRLDTDSLLRKLLISSERALTLAEKDFGVCFYNDELEAMVNREADIRQALTEVADGIPGDELYLQYQPILDVRSRSICGFEALARLKTRKLGLVLPVEFIPIAERTKMIIPIGEQIIVKAFQFLTKLQKQGYGSVSVSINVSVIQLLRHDFVERLLGLIADMGVAPINIGIELTESVFAADYVGINHTIEVLKDAGLRIAIDDFGTGYSSLAREKELNVNCLKIDKYFIDKLLDSDPQMAITSDIISMAHKLGHCAVAEGVEHERQLQYLIDHQCDHIQGYLISKPLDEDAALHFLREQQQGSPCHSVDW
ncbi:MAG: EAL domain-containing protein [Candidatus Limiplasma sp.]|nr:EAL domain-containing protein [Candidatus Limiplasma sp.]